MDEYFVRVYTLHDGSKAEPNAVYAKYEQAAADLMRFNPSGEGVDDLQNVSYVQIEKRFSPRPFWDDAPLDDTGVTRRSVGPSGPAQEKWRDLLNQPLLSKESALAAMRGTP